MKDQFSAHQKEFRAQINEILSPDQKPLFKKMLTKRKNQKNTEKINR